MSVTFKSSSAAVNFMSSSIDANQKKVARVHLSIYFKRSQIQQEPSVRPWL